MRAATISRQPGHDMLPNLRLQPLLRLTRPMHCVRAVLLDQSTIRYGNLLLRDSHPIVALCKHLVATGHADCALVVRHANGSPACTDMSIHECARLGSEVAGITNMSGEISE